jgi:hypothetical protein
MFFHVEHDSASERRSGLSRDSRRCSRMSKGRRRSKAHMVVEYVECLRAEHERAQRSALRLSQTGLKPGPRASPPDGDRASWHTLTQ